MTQDHILGHQVGRNVFITDARTDDWVSRLGSPCRPHMAVVLVDGDPDRWYVVWVPCYDDTCTEFFGHEV